MVYSRLIILAVYLIFPLIFWGQVNVTPSSANSCTCDGSFTFVSPVPGPLTYSVIDNTGGIAASGASASGNFAVLALCPTVYTLSIVQNGITTEYYFSIPTSGLNPGNAEWDSVCSTEGSVNLNSYIPGLAAGGIWYSPAGTITAPQPLPAATIQEGWYTYEVQSGACFVSTGVYIDFIQNANPGLSTAYEICETYVPFLLTDFMQGSPDYNGQWYDPSGNPMNGIYDPATMNSGLFTYVIDAVVGCTPVVSTMNVDENPQPSAGLDSEILVCQNGVPFSMLAQVAGFPDAGGQWVGPNNAAVNNTFNPATYLSGIYRYTVSAQAPCVSDQSFLTVNFIADNPSGSSSTISVCETGANINMISELNGTPLAGGTWTNANGQAVDGIFDPGGEPAGSFTYYYPNVGCSPANSVLTISLESLPNAGADNSLSVCENVASINLNSLLSPTAQPGGIWTYSNGTPTSNTFVPPASGTNFQFTYTASGTLCPSDQASFTVNLQQTPTPISNQTQSFCPEDPDFNLFTFYPGLPSIYFENLNGSPGNSIFDPSIGTNLTLYAVNPSQNSCPPSVATVTLNVATPVFVDDSINVDVCNSQGNFNLNSVLPVSQSSSGSWLDQNEIPTATLIPLDFLGDRTYHFILTGTSACAGNELYLTIHCSASVNAGESASFIYCNTAPSLLLTELLPESAVGTGYWTYNGQPYAGEEINPAINQTGSYLYVVPANGACPSDAAELYITIQQGLNFSAGEDIVACEGSPSVHIGQAPIINATYFWSPGANLSSTSLASPLVDLSGNIDAATTTLYTVQVTDGVCNATDEVTVTINPIPQFELGPSLDICRLESVDLHSPLDGNCTWTPSYLFQDNQLPEQSVTPEDDTTVQLTIQNDEGCSYSDQINIVVHPLPVLVVLPEQYASCQPLEVEYHADASSSNIESLIWTIPGVGTFNDDTLRTVITESGYYDLHVTAFSDFGCESSLNFTNLMEVYPNPDAIFTSFPKELTTIDPIAQFINESVNAVSYEWNFAELGYSTEESPQFEFPNSDPANFEICLRVTSSEGCIDSTCRTLHLDNEYILYVPNSFTPDADGINDVFFPILKGFDENTYLLQIFDRWGEVVFQSNEIGEVWTGNAFNGEYYVKDDVYHWQIQVKDKEMADYRVFRGTVTVIR